MQDGRFFRQLLRYVMLQPNRPAACSLRLKGCCWSKSSLHTPVGCLARLLELAGKALLLALPRLGLALGDEAARLVVFVVAVLVLPASAKRQPIWKSFLSVAGMLRHVRCLRSHYVHNVKSVLYRAYLSPSLPEVGQKEQKPHFSGRPPICLMTRLAASRSSCSCRLSSHCFSER